MAPLALRRRLDRRGEDAPRLGTRHLHPLRAQEWIADLVNPVVDQRAGESDERARAAGKDEHPPASLSLALRNPVPYAIPAIVYAVRQQDDRQIPDKDLLQAIHDDVRPVSTPVAASTRARAERVPPGGGGPAPRRGAS